MHRNNITAEVLYSTRTLVANVSKLLALHVFHIRPAARIPLGHDGSLWPRCLLRYVLFAFCPMVLPHQLDGKRPTPCALVKTKNHSLLRHRGFNIENVTYDVMTQNGCSQMGWIATITWFITQAFTLDIGIVCGHQMAAWQVERTVGRNLGCVPRVILDWNDHRNVAIVCTVRYSRYGQPINDCPRPR